MYTVALIGCGRISSKHIEAMVNNQDALKLVACCDVIEEKAYAKINEFAAKVPSANVKAFTEYKKMLDEMKPDICAIATESGLHKSIAIDCLKTGAHVLCEKPMALSTEDADEMIKTAEECNKQLGVCFQNRFNLPVVKMRQALEEGRFGRLLHGAIQIRWNRGDSYYKEAPWRGTWEMDGGTLMNQCSHGIDLLQWMMGNAKRVHAVTRRFMRPIEAEDFGAAIIEFDSGSVGIIEGSACVYPKNLEEKLSLFGEKGTAVIGGVAVNKIETWRFSDSAVIGDAEDKMIATNGKDPDSVYGDGHTALYRDFVNAIKNNKKPLIYGVEGKKAIEIILAIYKSQKTGKPVDLPLNFSTTEMIGTFK